ncbi:MAG: hypothetical protein ACREX4_21120 [Gammaproteobacteria bacterium]
MSVSMTPSGRSEAFRVYPETIGLGNPSLNRKPKGMRWRTLERLEAKHDAFVGESLAGAMSRFGIRMDEL